jgi:glycosyltransferase involved in cell wall biosynthesis
MSDLQGIKDRIKNLIERGYIKEAREMISSLKKVTGMDPEVISIESVILFSLGKFNEAKNMLEEALTLFPNNQDLLFNLASIEESLGDFQKAFDYYHDLNSMNDPLVKEDVEFAIARLKEIDNSLSKREKMVFFCKKGLDSFLDDVVSQFEKEYNVKKIIVTDLNQVNQGLEWADISWFEWCDELLIYGSKLPLAESKKILCRLHSYEAFTSYINQVKWSSVDKVIFVAEHIKQYVLEHESSIQENQVAVIPNGIDLGKFAYEERKKGFNIAFVGYINYKKGPMLLLQSFKSIFDYDQRYKLHIAGEFQDPRYALYFKQMIVELGLEKNVFFHGWQKDINKWLEDKNYIISTSVLESQHLSIMEAMAKGIKPLVHNFVGAKKVYDKRFVWNTPNDLIKLIKDEYKSKEYHQFVSDNYNIKKQSTALVNLVKKDSEKAALQQFPLITVGIINYNYSHYLDECLDSILNQTYKNLDILIIDDCSTDGSIEKIKEIESKFSNVRTILHEKNVGHAIKSFQEVIQFATGEFFVMISADDFLLEKTAIEEQVNVFLTQPSVDYVYGDLQLVDDNKKPIEVWRYSDLNSEDVVRLTFERGGSGVLPMTVGMYRTAFYQSENLNWLHNKKDLVGADTYNSLVNARRGWKTKYINKAYYGYRRHSTNMSTNGLKKRVNSLTISLEYIINNFDEKVYLPQTRWEQLNVSQKNYHKNFQIGIHYYNLFKRYYLDGFNLAGEEVKFEQEDFFTSVKPFLKYSQKYLRKSLSIFNSTDVKELLEQINKYLLNNKI